MQTATWLEHTGNFKAAVKAVEVLDECIGKLKKSLREKNVTMLITADHGNCDQMIYENGGIHTSHTNAPVPFCMVHPILNKRPFKLNITDAALKDVAPHFVT